MTPQSDEDEVWRQIVASFHAPDERGSSDQPWPDSENLTPEPAARLGDRVGDDDPTADLPATPQTDPREPGDQPDAKDQREPHDHGDLRDHPDLRDLRDPFEGTELGTVSRRPLGRRRFDHEALDLSHQDPVEQDKDQSGDDGRDDEGHYDPPPPPPLPKADTTTKLAWLALFGGPAYLLMAAMLGWHMEGWALFGAVAAFIGGFVALVIRMGDGPPNDSGWDDGAVV
ncbi:hypothetical protein [Sinosporangium siamense]|uniref:DUF308 domain-containing protein n=1 Tax=Sinosporangium siamense TaxID=1367973 RepID=A0A919RA65_9ACTN|nr:hypothetical protein [Sinosporangium siamense]GII90220.1 hypothetical protein Ssi02_04510 [Sinosporangium siamense]